MNSLALIAFVFRVVIWIGLLIALPSIAARSDGAPHGEPQKKQIKKIQAAGFCLMVLVEALVIANPIGLFL